MTVTHTPIVPTPPDNHQRKRWLLGLTALFVILGLGYALYWFGIGQFNESTDDAYVDGNSVQVMSQIAGQVTHIFADETDLVKKGSVLVELDKVNTEIALKNAEAKLALTVRQVNQYYENANQAKSNVQLQQDNFEKAKEDYDRREGLIVNKTISIEDLRHAKIAMKTAQDAWLEANQRLASAVALVGNVDLYHHPLIEQSAVEYRTAYLNWRRTTIYAAVTGYVAKRAVQVGQEVNPNTILMIIVPLNELWINANFKESQLKHIRIGQKVMMYSDAYGGSVKYQGTVVGLNPGTGSAFQLLPPQNATGNWIKIVQRLPVRIKIDPQQLERNPLQIGLSMTVTINTKDRRGEVLNKNAANKVVYSALDYSTDLKKADEMIQHILESNASNTQFNKGP